MTKTQFVSPREQITGNVLLIAACFSGLSLVLFLFLAIKRDSHHSGTGGPLWVNAILLTILLVGALIALRISRKNVGLAIEGYSWLVVMAIGIMVWNHYNLLAGDKKPPTILLFLHIAIFCLGLAKGFGASIRLSAGVLILLAWVTLASGKIGITLPMILAVLAMNIPPWLVDRMEIALRRSEERFKLVFLDSADIQLIVDRQSFTILEVNRSGLSMFCCLPEQMKSKELSEFLPDGLQYLKLPKAGSESGIPPHVITLRAKHRDGSTFPVEVTASLIPWSSSEAVLLILRDVTVRLHFEQELERYRHHLEELVAERTSDLEKANGQLKERSYELEEMIASLNAFSRMVAHDLKNPLTAVQGFNELLFMDAESGNLPAIIDNSRSISINVGRMTRIIDELLLLAGIQRSSEVPLYPLDMGKIWQEACDRLADMILDAKASVSGPSEWPVVLGHEPWIEEVWVNYLSNALKYSGNGSEGNSPCIEAGWTRCQADERPSDQAGEQTPNQMIKFWILDNGPGIPSEARHRLFHEFVRLDPDRAAGHGLGLSIVKRIITRQGGQVGVESRRGEGSRFTFTLPEQQQ